MNTYIKNMGLVIALGFSAVHAMDGTGGSGGAAAGAGAGAGGIGADVGGADDAAAFEYFLENQPGLKRGLSKGSARMRVSTFGDFLKAAVCDLSWLYLDTGGFQSTQVSVISDYKMFVCSEPGRGLGILRVIVDAICVAIAHVKPEVSYSVNVVTFSNRSGVGMRLVDYVAKCYEREAGAEQRLNLMNELFGALISLDGGMGRHAEWQLGESKKNVELMLSDSSSVFSYR